eukprot:gene33202-40173_t
MDHLSSVFHHYACIASHIASGSSKSEDDVKILRFPYLSAACFAVLGVEVQSGHLKDLVSQLLSEEEITHVKGLTHWQFERLVADLIGSRRYVVMDWPLSSKVLYSEVLDVRRRGWLLSEDWSARLSEVAPNYAASHGKAVFDCIDEHGVRQVSMPKLLSILDVDTATS